MSEKLTKKELKEQRKIERTSFEQQLKNSQKNENFKKIFLWSLLTLVLVASVVAIAFLTNSSTSNSPTSASIKFEKINSSDLAFGPKSAKVTLVEYADFQCPACGAYYPVVKQLLKDFNGKMLYVYRFFPLENIHQNALISAKAGYSVYEIDKSKFLQMEDLLFTNQANWENLSDPTSVFTTYATSLGINKNQFLSTLNSAQTGEFVKAQENKWLSDGINSTPTFAINGKIITNPSSYEAFKAEIQSAIK